MSSRPVSDRLPTCGPCLAPQGLARPQVRQVRRVVRCAAPLGAGAVALYAPVAGGEEAQRVETGHGREPRGGRLVAPIHGPAALASLASAGGSQRRLIGLCGSVCEQLDGPRQATSVGSGEGFLFPTFPAVRSEQPVTCRPGAVTPHERSK